MNNFDCIVVGGGHAGAEAGHAAARIGGRTLLITMSADTIAKMSCNPAIGGLAKGQIVREIDALGGLMALAIDATGIQFRQLNRSKGPAVRSPRAQADKYQYKAYIRKQLERTDNLTIAEGVAAEVLTCGGKVCGVRCEDGTVYNSSVVVITAGTFLRGVMHMGREQWGGGRLGEPASNELSDSLRRLGIKLGRLKTGTPARLDGATIDYDKTELQEGDAEPVAFSFMTEKLDRPQVPCWITYTNEKIHQLLRDNLHLAPMYSGQIQAAGPRYCPSIETKVVRFADKGRHQVFLEPEDENATTIYCNGISTSVPKDVQDKMLKLLAGTENAKVVHYAYAIEYDYAPAYQLKPSLESKVVEGLFLAGQINGTSGYEEAAGQGLMAGLNAMRKVQGKEPIVLGRDQAYIGVLIDDLLTKDIQEPYRMFTSRAEYRLSLRADNADRRLTAAGRDAGLVDDARWERFCKKLEDVGRLSERLKGVRLGGKSLWQLLKQPESDISKDPYGQTDVKQMGLTHEVVEAAVIDARYEGYLARQAKQIEGLRNMEKVKLPAELEYGAITHLSNEGKSKLSAMRPATLGQASRIGGITPADITIIRVHLKTVNAEKDI